ncbi:MAG TPA: transcription termination factor NusA [Candidatus Saccharimonadales bacterium]|nr:transcription termination factor NusA [Candidatus Saccharimonadales bacterium]
MATQTARTEFAQALKAVATQTGLDVDVIIAQLKEAVIAAYKRDFRGSEDEADEFQYDVDIHGVTGEIRIFAYRAEKPEEREDVTPPGFGRIAAQTAKQVIHQRIREAERGAIISEFQSKLGGLISGMILRFDGGNVRVEIGRAEGVMPYDKRIPNERLSLNQRLTFLFEEVKETPRGQEIILSRNTPAFVEKLFAREVPEIGSGSVTIKAIAREAGVRTKIAVASSQSGVDPVGSCVGQKGVRVQAVTNELGGERIDIILWNEDEKELVKGSLSPVEVVSLKLNKKAKTAKVVVPAEQLSIAIGANGQNVRLASKLTGYEIDIEGVGEVKSKEDVEREAVLAQEEVKEVKVKEVKELKVKKEKKVKKEEVVEAKTEEKTEKTEK